MPRTVKMTLIPPCHFLLLSYLCETFKLPVGLQICELLIWQIRVSPTHYLTFERKKKKLITLHDMYVQ
jgi:hypothetical protein